MGEQIKVVLYKENRVPKSIALTTGLVYKTMALAMVCGLVLIVSVALAVRFYLVSRAKTSQTTAAISSSVDESGFGPSNSVEDQARALRDEVDQLKSRLANAQATLASPKEIDRRNAALGLFTPVVVDRTQGQDNVTIANVTATKGKTSGITFELHNAHEGASTEKGYIVILARAETQLMGYPNIFNKTGPYLLDFERGETFQVARFRMVNAQFEAPVDNFQILIFTRKGELLINTIHEAK